MRMKFNKSSQLLLVSAASLLVAGLVTACGTLTVDFVFVASSKAAGSNNYGEIDVLEINSESGYMRHIPTSPFPSGGRNPVAEAISADQTNLYVVNQDDNSIVQFVIGNDGKVYPQNTVNTPGIYPLAVAVSGTNLYVVDTYQPLPICSNADPCSGSIGVLPITIGSGSPPSDTLGSPVANGSLTYWPLNVPCNPTDVLTPTGINVLPSGNFVFVTGYDATAATDDTEGIANTCDATASTSSAPTGYVFVFAANSDGTLTAVSGSPFLVGTVNVLPNGGVVTPKPSAVASDPSSSYVYVTDFNLADVHAYSVNSSGALTELSGSPFPTGNQPAAIAADSKYPYLYVANTLDSSVTAYSLSAGALTTLGTFATGTQPVAMGIDPSTNHFLFTANYLGSGIVGTVSGFVLNPSTGMLVDSQKSPFTVNALPTAVAAIPHPVTQSNSK
jgi:6-phosphogluconolactonase